MNLVDIMPALAQPFSMQDIDFLPKNNFEQNGQVVCLSLPFADKRVYEDRLNAVCPGEWSDSASALVAGSKIVAVVTVVVAGVPHTDFGEADLSSENAATEAYAQGFKRACSKFGLGRYLYELEKQFLPWDRAKKRYSISQKEKLAIVKAMYQKVGLLSSAPRIAPEHQQMDTSVEADQPVSSAQKERIEGLCQRLKKPVALPSTHAGARELIQTLTEEYRKSKQSA